ncbi:hypothetical protein D3C72_688960 [compost metagenome]
MRLGFFSNVLRVGKNQACLSHAVGHAPFDFSQARRWLRFGIVQVSQVMQGDDGRAVERQRPQTRFVVEVDGLRAALIEAFLLQPPSGLIGPRNLPQQWRQSGITGHGRFRQHSTPAPAMKQRQFNIRFTRQGVRQFGNVVADAGARRLEDAGVKGNAHVASLVRAARPRDCAGCVRPIAHWLHASRSSASPRRREWPGIDRCSRNE